MNMFKIPRSPEHSTKRGCVTFITTLPNTRSSLDSPMTFVMNVINVGQQQACKRAS